MKKLFTALVLLIVFGALTSCKKTATPTPTPTTDSLAIGLLAYYPFNNSGADSSGNGNNINYYYSITPALNRLNKPNTAFLFDGSKSYMTVRDNADLRLNNTDFTINVWVNLNTYNSTSGSQIMTKRTSGINNGWGFSITGTQSTVGAAGGIYFGPGGGNAYALSTKKVTLNKWSMITVVYNVNKQQVSLYLDGVLDNTTNNIPTPSALITANLFIGADNINNGTSYYINGALDDVRIYNKALSATLIQKLYTNAN